MNKSTYHQLFTAARNEPPPAPPEGFAADVLRAVYHEPARAPSEPFSIWTQLNELFPRLATAAAAVILLSAVADWGQTAAGVPDLSDSVAQAASPFTLDTDTL